MDEYEVALAAEETMRRLNDIETAAGIIATTGPNTVTGTSLPSRDKRTERGELFLLGLALRHEGSPGNNSRTQVAGDPGHLPTLHKKAYDASVVMNQEVRKAIEPGVTPKSDLLGHGLEMDVHSDPLGDDGRASRSRRGVAPGA
jgi:Xaa-Pro aminopeptidase